ncbi:leucine--tRNA ligase [Candidatus Pacearchaeota archaeon CG10_big_fil_rev_8_21_14_0_10_32_14]|nr:MAG: leucine--tRNA ligase [Candidatus Pacearchaeota archaeon CG10_big_fil_rev_8_21_14_0_10_32_14]
MKKKVETKMLEKKEINYNKIERKWQSEWEKKKVFVIKENPKKKKFYVLEMFPYPSGTGLHMGHAFNYTLGDVYARFKRMNGFNVLYPMGYDSLGLPAENAAIKAGEHPKKYTNNSIKSFMSQQKALGFSYDWTRMIKTHDPEYYKWDQWIFLKMLEKGIAYRKKAPVNYCKKCDSVLANEQVHNGMCWRHEDTAVEIKHLEQWFFKITDYADELLDKVDSLEWPERIKIMQKNWIGKSNGTQVDFEIETPAHKDCTLDPEIKKWPIFTTRVDTIYGVTFMVVSAQHPKLMSLVNFDQKKDVEAFLKKLKSVKQEDIDKMDKDGVFTGSYAINPLTKEKVPVYAGNFVVADYGTGMVMAVPAHDQRDYEFAVKYKLPIKQVIEPVDREFNLKDESRAFTGEGRLVNSDKFNGLENKKAIHEITKYLEEKKLGSKKVQFKLRDWLVSRQRYWGTPIPIVYCDKCGIVPISEKSLPLTLPEKVVFGKGNPLATNKNFVETSCPKCKSKARRETDTMDTFVNSSWYFLRYIDPNNKKDICDKKKIENFMAVDQYIGGAEHACMHLIYARFYTKFMRDYGIIPEDIDEPFTKLFNQGLIHGSDGNKMSKSLGNTVDPLEIVRKYSADSLRLALLSIASPDKNFNWDNKVVDGSFKFLNKVFQRFNGKNKFGKSSRNIESKVNKTIKEANIDIENFKYNIAIIKIRTLFDYIISFEDKDISKGDFESSLKLLSVFCPHITEELWHKLGNKNFMSLEEWPIFDEKKIDLNLEKEEEMIDKLGNDILNILRILESKSEKNKTRAIIYCIPNEVTIFKKEEANLEKRTNIKVVIKDIKDANQTEKKIKAMPGKPGILIK